MVFETKLAEIHGRLTLEHFPNEAAVSQGIVIPILRELNWDTDNPRVVYPEHTAGRGRRADFALCDDSGNPKIFIEVKKIGGDLEEGLDKLMQYAQSADVHIVVLTDGRTWSFYLPFEAGKDKEKQVCELHFSGPFPQESPEVLQRYLERSRVVSGEALKTAKVIFLLEKYRKNKPAAWKETVDDEIVKSVLPILRFLASRVAKDITNQDIINYFHSLLREKISPSTSGTTAQRTTQPEPKKRQVSASPSSVANGGGRSEKIVILGKAFPCKSATDAMVEVFKELERRKPGFYQRFYNSRWNRGKTRRVIAQDPGELYDDPGLKRKRYYRSLGGGWFIGTNNSKGAIERHIDKAAKVAGLTFGEDIIVNFDA